MKPAVKGGVTHSFDRRGEMMEKPLIVYSGFLYVIKFSGSKTMVYIH